MGEDDVEVREKTSVYDGYFRLDRYRLRHRLFAGGWSGEMVREVFERGHAAGILLYDPLRDEVVLIEQFRIGVHAAGAAPWLVEIVAGIVEPGESAEAVVRREAVEEAGCIVRELAPIGTVFLSPGGSSQTMALWCGGTDTAGAGGIHGLAHEHEDIRALVLCREQAHGLLTAGRIRDASTMIALQWLALNRDDLRTRWAAGGPP